MRVPMRIVYVLTTLAVGGTERQVLAIAGRMADRGHDVAVVVVRYREPDWLTTDLDVFSLEMRKSFSSALAGLRRGVNFLRAFRPHIVHSHNYHGNMLARLMRLFHPNAKLISTIHNVYEGGWLRMLAYRLSDGLVDRTTAVSAAVAEQFVDLKAVTNDKCVVITNGTEAAEFVPDRERRAAMRRQMGVTDEFVWLSVGRNTTAKDLPNLLQAFGKAWRTVPSMQLWMAGDVPGSGKKTAVAITMPHGAMDHVRRLGLRSDVASLLDAADGFVLSSAWEGMPLALGEAMTMEKPVIATDVGGVRELVGDTGVLVPAKDSQALAEAMLAVMERRPEERTAMGRAARERILKNFSMDAKADEWEGLYCSVSGHRAPQPAVVP